MQSLEALTQTVATGTDLSPDEAEQAATMLASPDISATAKEAFLMALSGKGESAAEVAAFASTFRGLAVDPGVDAWAADAIDVCGTGGDGASTFNISTAVSFLVAAAGVPVFKHGNRSITSKSGSADLIEALGIPLNASHEQLRASLRELNFCFFFAPAFHPAFKEIMPVRKALAKKGQRSIFNLLGPLINPGRPAHQLLGVFAKKWVTPIAGALDVLGLRAGLVAHCTPEPGKALDELSCAGQNHVAGFGALRERQGALSPDEAGLAACSLADLKGGDVEANLATLHALFGDARSSLPSGLVDSVLVNAGAALWIAGRADGLRGGVDQARQVLDSGAAARWLSGAQAFYAQN